jgi:hypothetical protein
VVEKGVASIQTLIINPMKTKFQLLFTLTPALAMGLFLAGSSPSLSHAADAAPAKVELKFVRVDSEETAGENG